MTLEIIKRYHIKAKKSLWQNFLVNEEILNQISSFLSIHWENIIEVWPGYWALTERLLQKSPLSLTLVELDENMIRIIEDRISRWELLTKGVNFEIRNQYILKYTPGFHTYSVVANIPYYITSPILRHFIYDVEHIPETMIILMQKDVGDKILWNGKNKSSVIRLLVNKKYDVEEIIKVPKENFIPAPKVESSILFFKKHNLYTEVDDDIFLTTIKIWFSSSRKKLVSNLKAWGFQKQKVLDIFKGLKIEENIRWEDLDISQWCHLIQEL